jgi:predicted Rossmann fold flavoprotein
VQKFDVVVIGAGAAGLFCAAIAAKRGKRVLVLERGAKPGAKILISGGGRCNFTNREVRPEHFISGNRHFCKSALAGFSSRDFIALVEAAGIAYHEKTLGQLFCDGSAAQILDMLLADCRSSGVELRLNCAVTGCRRGKVPWLRQLWSWRPADFPSPSWAPRVSPMRWRGNLACRSCNRAQAWCR